MSTNSSSGPEELRSQAVTIVGGQAAFDALYARAVQYFRCLGGEVLTLETQAVAATVDDGLQVAAEVYLAGVLRELSEVQRTTVARALVQRGWEEVGERVA